MNDVATSVLGTTPWIGIWTDRVIIRKQWAWITEKVAITFSIPEAA